MSDEWLPIDSAPKDGTEVLLWMPPNDEFNWGGFMELAEYWVDSGWVGSRTHSPYDYATHWRRMPEPPLSPAKDKGHS